MLCELKWFVKTLAQAFSCEFCKTFKNIVDHIVDCFFLSQDENIKIHYDNYMQKVHCVVVTEAYLQIFTTQSKIYDELFFEKLVND